MTTDQSAETPLHAATLAALREATAPEDLADRVVAIRRLEAELAGHLEAIRAARRLALSNLKTSRGLTWRAVGALLGGITPQAAEQLARRTDTEGPTDAT